MLPTQGTDMSPVDNVVAFRKRGESPEQGQPLAPDAEVEVVSPAAKTLTAIDSLISFLSANRANIKSFVGGFFCEDPPIPDGAVAFHSISSPIEPADYALALRMLEDSFRQMLTSGPD